MERDRGLTGQDAFQKQKDDVDELTYCRFADLTKERVVAIFRIFFI